MPVRKAIKMAVTKVGAALSRKKPVATAILHNAEDGLHWEETSPNYVVFVSPEQHWTLEVGDLYLDRKILRIDEMAGSYKLTLE